MIRSTGIPTTAEIADLLTLLEEGSGLMGHLDPL
jgi:hypothetical protein